MAENGDFLMSHSVSCVSWDIDGTLMGHRWDTHGTLVRHTRDATFYSNLWEARDGTRIHLQLIRRMRCLHLTGDLP
jgi:hypothetical protein